MQKPGEAVRKSAVIYLFLAAFVVCAEGPASAPAFEVSHYPVVAYAGENATFVVRGPQGAAAAVTFDAKPLDQATFTDEPIEFNLKLATGGKLRFRCETVEYVFHVVMPTDKVALTVKDGCLFAGEHPAVLLPRHRHPPKHDRTWETVRVVSVLVGKDQRPKVRTVMVYGGAQLPDLPELPNAWRLVRRDVLPGLIAGLRNRKPADVLLVNPSLRDLALGTSPLTYRMQLEWLLQAVDRRTLKHVYVVAPAMTEHEEKAYPELREYLKLAAAGNSADLIAPGLTATRGTVDRKDWLSAVRQRLQKTVVLQ